MQTVAAISIVLLFSIVHGKTASDLKCFNDTVDFASKVRGSSIIVYGKATGKALKDGSDSIFHVSFRVDCILKGPIIAKYINISDAGQIEHRNFCQEFPLGRGYSIAFLERNPVNSNDTQNFVPSDFVDMIYQKNITDRLLADTCGMKATLPMGAMEMIRDVCPMVSTTSRCMEPPNTTTMATTINDLGSIVRKSGTVQVDVDRQNQMSSMSLNIILIFIMLFSFRLLSN